MSETILKTQQLCVGYGQSEIIQHLDFELERGQIVALMGLNGMGKTTLMKALIGLLPLRSGSVVLGSTELSHRQPYERVLEGLAYVPQGRMVFPRLTVEENIETGLTSTGESIPEALYSYFPVLRAMKRRRGGNLSGGQQQQLAIARALASRPRVLLLDEPTEGVQPSLIQELAVILKQIRDESDLTVLVSEQVLSFAASVADRLLVLERGQIVYDSGRSSFDELEIRRRLSI